MATDEQREGGIVETGPQEAVGQITINPKRAKFQGSPEAFKAEVEMMEFLNAPTQEQNNEDFSFAKRGFEPEDNQFLHILGRLESNTFDPREDVATQQAQSMQTPARIAKTGERPVGSLQFEMADVGQTRKAVQKGLREGIFSESTINDIAVANREFGNNPRKWRDAMFAIFTSRPTDANQLNVIGIENMKNDPAKLKFVSSPVASSFIYNNPTEAARLLGSVMGMRVPDDLGKDAAIAKREEIFKAWGKFEQKMGKQEADQAIIDHFPEWLQTRPLTDTLITFQNRHQQLTTGLYDEALGVVDTQDLNEFLQDMTRIRRKDTALNPHEELNRSFLERMARAAKEEIGSVLPLSDKAGTAEMLLDMYLYPGNLLRSQIAKFAQEHNLSRDHNVIPEEIDGFELLTSVFDISPQDLAAKIPELDRAQPLIPQLLKIASPTGWVFENPGFIAGIAAEEATDVTALVGGAILKLASSGYKKVANSQRLKNHAKAKAAIQTEAERSIKAFSRNYNKQLEEVKKTLSDPARDQLAAERIAAGEDLSTIAAKMERGAIPDSVDIHIFNRLMVQDGQSLQQSAKTLLRGIKNGKPIKNDDALFQSFIREAARFSALSTLRESMVTNLGRGLRELSDEDLGKYLGNINQFLSEVNRSFSKGEHSPLGFIKLLASIDDPETLFRATKAIRQPGLAAVYTELYVNSLLANTANLMGGNLYSNSLMIGWQLARKWAGAITRENTFTEAGVYTMGTMGNFVNALRLGWRTWKTEKPSSLTSKIDLETSRAFTADTFGIENQATAKAVNFAGQLFRTPQRFLLASDELFKGINAGAEFEMLMYRKSTNGLIEGKPWKQFAKEVWRNPEKYRRFIPELKEARRKGEFSTFTNPLGEVGEAVIDLANSHPLLRLVLPFIRTPINLTKMTFGELIGLKRLKDVWQGKLVHRDPAVRAAARTDLLMTSGFYAGMIKMLDDSDGRFRITGPEIADARARRFIQQNTKWEPNALQWDRDGDGKFETSISLNRIDPFGQALSIIGLLYNHKQYLSEQEYAQMASAGVLTLAQTFEDKAMYSGVAELFDLIASSESFVGDAFERAVRRSLTKLMIVPGFLDGAEAMMDPARRDASTLWNSFASKIPGLSKEVPVVFNFFGDPMIGLGPITEITDNPGFMSTLVGNFFPFIGGLEVESASKDDQRKFNAIMFMVNRANYIPAKISEKQELAGQKLELTPEGLSWYTEAVGKNMLETVERVMKTTRKTTRPKIIHARLSGIIGGKRRTLLNHLVKRMDKGTGRFVKQREVEQKLLAPVRGISGTDPLLNTR